MLTDGSMSVAFACQALMGVLKKNGGSTTTSPALSDPLSYPVPNMQFLVNQSIATASQPNNLCLDDNLFIKCSCSYPHAAGAIIANDDISNYFQAGLRSPMQSLFSTAHSVKAYYGVCFGVLSAAVTTASPVQVRFAIA